MANTVFLPSITKYAKNVIVENKFGIASCTIYFPCICFVAAYLVKSIEHTNIGYEQGKTISVVLRKKRV